MNISRFALCALLTLALPALAQPDAKPGTELPYPKVTPEDAAKLGLTEKPMQFHLRDVTLLDAVTQLSEKSGVGIIPLVGRKDKELQNKLSLDLETHSFDEAFAAILKASNTKAYLQFFSRNGNWFLAFGDNKYREDEVVSGAGAFQLCLSSFDLNSYRGIFIKRTTAPNRSQNGTLTANFRVVLDPQLSEVGLVQIRFSRADDDKGRSLMSQKKNSSVYNNYTFSQMAQVPFLLPQTDAKSIAHLEGVAVYVLPSKHETVEIPNVLNAKNQSVNFQSGGQTIRLNVKNATNVGDDITVNLVVSREPIDKADDVPNPLLTLEQIRASLHLVDAKGRALELDGINGTGSSSGWELNAKFILPFLLTPPATGMDGQPMPAQAPTFNGPIKLVFNVPTEFVQTQVPFSFHDLPLP